MSKNNSILRKGRVNMRAKNPLIPMAAITGTPTREDIRKVMKNYSDAGIRQFLIYPRSGCEIEYMSEAWFELCRNVIETGEELGFDIWLYDEYNFPSATCNGQVLAENPEFVLKVLDIGAAEGKAEFKILTHPGFANVFDPDCTDKFIELTHERYASRFGKYFGNTVQGIFTDEPSFAYGCKQYGDHLRIPYYAGLEEEYEKLKGSSLFADLEKHIAGQTPAGLWPTFFQLVGKQMKTAFCDRVQAWCTKHNLFMTGHLYSEDSETMGVLYNGNILQSLKSFTLPGMDDIHTLGTLSEAEWVTFGTVKYAIDARNNGGLAELFSVSPCDIPIARERQMLWLTALYGVDHYLFAVPQLDARGNIEKPYYFNPNSITQPWFPAFREWGEDAAIAAGIAHKTCISYIQVRYPQTLATNNVYSGLVRCLKDTGLRTLLETLVNLQHPWELIAEEDEASPSARAVLALTKDGILEEKTGACFSGIEEVSGWLERNIARPCRVENPDGSLAGKLLVKTYTDGTVVVLDLTAEIGARRLILKHGDVSRTFELFGRGVMVTKDLIPPELLPATAQKTDTDSFELILGNPNFLRCIFPGEQQYFEFALDSDMENLKFVLRTYGGEADILLDGKPLETFAACSELPEGLRSLYKTSKPVSLKQGRHSVTLTSAVRDYPYLPLCFLCGDFAVYPGNVLGKTPKSAQIGSLLGKGLLNYAGKITLTADVTVPLHNGDVFLSLDTNQLYTEVRLDGISLGRRAWAPFVWKIPEEMKGGKKTLEVIEYTSVGALFGDVAKLLPVPSPWSDWYWDTNCGRFTDCGLLSAPEWLLG